MLATSVQAPTYTMTKICFPYSGTICLKGQAESGGGGGGLLKIQQTERQTRQQTGDTDWTQGVMINY